MDGLSRTLRVTLVLGVVVLVLLGAIVLWLRREDRAAGEFERVALGLRAGTTARDLLAHLPDRQGERGVYLDEDGGVAVLAPFATARRWYCIWYKVPVSAGAPDPGVIEALRVYAVEPVFGMRGRRRDEHIRASVHASVLQGSYSGVELLHEAQLDDARGDPKADRPGAERERSQP